MTDYQLVRAFRTAYGQSPGRYLKYVRMSHARRLLLATRLPVQDIARRCGYRSHGTFSTKFREQFGVSPSDYRARGNAAPVATRAVHTRWTR